MDKKNVELPYKELLRVKSFTRHFNLHSYVLLLIQVSEQRLQFGSVSKCPNVCLTVFCHSIYPTL